MAPDLEGQTAFVSGGGRGIGRAICATLAGYGADVVIADLDDEEMAGTAERVEAEGRRAEPVFLDLRDPDRVEAAVAEAREAVGSVEILVNNAGIAGPTAPCEEVSLEEWDETMAVNLRGAFLLTRELLPGMKEAGYGRIVNIASITGKRPLYNRTPYAASKLGLVGFTRTLAEEVGEYDVNVNAVCPGSVEGPRIDDVYEKQAEARGISYEEVRAEAEAEAPREELVRGEDVGEVVAFLSSPRSSFVNGVSVPIDGGAGASNL
jgi:NAD(P)-dependent dehydrogenase (short-subunit alcohol dehydrogenase family)